MRDGDVQLFLPSICVTEAIKVLDGWDKEWRRFSNHFRSFSGIGVMFGFQQRSWHLDGMFAVGGMPDPLQASAELADRAERQTWETLERLAASAHLLELRAPTIARASSIRDFLKLSAADAVVLSLVAQACQEGSCRDFVSKDRAFGKSETRTYMRQIGLVHWSNAAAFLAAKSAG